jgi:glucose-1-phosphate cytidylyltransferase
MKTFILAGGYGSRLGIISENIPKPMIEIGGRPILWHVMKYYSCFGFNEFVLLLGYKNRIIKEYFANYHIINNNFEVDLKTGKFIFYNTENIAENWKITLLDTGLDNLKGSRIKQAERFADDDIHFLTYGDGVSNVDIKKLLEFHNKHGKMITITGVRPPSRFGELNLDGNKVITFEEKPQLSSAGYINGGFMVFNKSLFSRLSPEKDCDFEFGPLEKLAKEGEVMMYGHDGFWECVDTERDLNYLNGLWRNGNAKWKIW